MTHLSFLPIGTILCQEEFDAPEKINGMAYGLRKDGLIHLHCAQRYQPVLLRKDKVDFWEVIPLEPVKRRRKR